MLALNLRTRSGAIFAILFFAILLVVIPASAQSDDVLRIDTDLAAFEITVTDKDGNPVRNLDSKDFRVIEDGMPRQIDFFQPIKKEDPTRPLSVVLRMDPSVFMSSRPLECRLRRRARNMQSGSAARAGRPPGRVNEPGSDGSRAAAREAMATTKCDAERHHAGPQTAAARRCGRSRTDRQAPAQERNLRRRRPPRSGNDLPAPPS